jgi:uroporphyrinogen-III synthase
MGIKNILISQKQPLNLAPYTALTEKYGVNITFEQFYLIEPLSSREFRAQRINPLSYTAMVFSSRHAIDAFFHLCEELRVKIPESMKYFCTTEAVAMYLQKHIVYRKRKIFYGKGTPESIIEAIGPKHKDEKFLITMSSDTSNSEVITKQFDENGLDYNTGIFVKPVSQDLKNFNLSSYDMIVFYNPNDVKSLYENFPDFEQKEMKFISYGKSIVKAMEEHGLKVEIEAPTPDCPSVAGAIGIYMESLK